MGHLPRHRPGILTARAGAVVLAVCLPLFVPARPSAQVIDRVLATVNGQPVTLSDARAAVALGLVASPSTADDVSAVLSELIERELVLVEANRYAAPVAADDAVNRRLSEVRARFASDTAFREALEANAMTERRLRERVQDDLRIAAYLDERFLAAALPTDEEIARYFEANRAEFVREGRQLELDEARDLARERTVDGRRRSLVAEWVAQLRSRADVNIVSGPAR